MVDFNVIFLFAVQLAGLVLQVAILLFSYVKTGKLAPMVVAISTIVLAIMPFLLARVIVEPTQFMLSSGIINLLNTGLFVWLVYALSTPIRRSKAVASEDV